MKAGQQSVRPMLDEPLLPRPEGEPVAPSPRPHPEGNADDQMVTFVVPLPSGRSAVVGLPVGCLPQEALYLVAKMNELAETAYRSGPQPRWRPQLWVPT